MPTPSIGMSSAPSASPSATAAASGTPAADAGSIDPAVIARAREWLHRVQTAKIDRTQLDATMNSVLTDSVAAQAAKQFGALGEPTSFTFVDKRRVSTNTVYRFRVVFSASTLAWFLAIDDTGKISGLRFAPPQ